MPLKEPGGENVGKAPAATKTGIDPRSPPGSLSVFQTKKTAMPMVEQKAFWTEMTTVLTDH